MIVLTIFQHNDIKNMSKQTAWMEEEHDIRREDH